MVKDNCIAFYLSNEYILTPLDGKIPKTRKWQHSKYDPFFSCDGNYGVVLEDNDLIVDIDPRNGGQVPSFLNNVNTFTVKTGGGGWHYYFKKPSNVQVVGLLKAFPGIEFKTKGQQVVGAGCVTNAEYIIINDAPVIQCPFLDIVTRREVLKNKTDKKIEYTNDQQTQDRFIDYLKQCPVAIEGQNGDRVTFSVAAHARDLGLEEALAVQLMVVHYNPRCVPPWPIEEINIKVNNAYKYAQNDAGILSPKADFDALPAAQDGVTGWEHDKAGRLKATFKNTLNALLMPNTAITGLLKFNEFSEDIEFSRETPWHKNAKDSKYWTDADAVMMKEWLSNNYSFAPSVVDIHECALAISKRQSYHPVHDYLRVLKWDGKARIDTWLRDHAGVEDNEYTRAVSRIVLCAAVARVFKPGIKFDYMMVLEGYQGQGKSRLCAALGAPWYTDARLDPHNKDFVDIIRRKWIIEIAEMDTATRSEVNAIKAFLSRDTDSCRLAYARITKDFQRQCIIIGTYNPLDGESAYLKDPTGERRYWPITLGKKDINIEAFMLERDQLWAEAVVKAKDCKLYLEGEAKRLSVKAQEERREHDPWFDTIADWVETNVLPGKCVSGISIFQMCLGGLSNNYGAAEGRRIAGVMRMLDWPKCQVWNKAKLRSDRGWMRPGLTKINIEKSIDNAEIGDII